MSGQDITLHPAYQSAANAITKPTSLLISRYVVEKWLPDMGGDGLAILSFFRKKCYYNRETGEKRDQVKCKLAEVAKGCKMSVSTVRRCLQKNDALRRFVIVQEEFEVEPKRKGLYQVENSYHVLMDDPVHPSDLDRLQEAIREIVDRQEKGAEDPKERARRRHERSMDEAGGRSDNRRPAPTPSQNDAALGASPTTPSQNDRPLSQNDRGAYQNGVPPSQNDAANKGVLNSSNSLNSVSSPAAPGDSLALFSDKDVRPSAEAPPPWAVAWHTLTAAEREVWHRRGQTDAQSLGVAASNVPAILKRAKALFREAFQDEPDAEKPVRK